MKQTILLLLKKEKKMKIRKAKFEDISQIKKSCRKILYGIFKVKPTDLNDLENIKRNYILFYVAEDKGEVEKQKRLKMIA